jgi:hypothetical protein
MPARTFGPCGRAALGRTTPRIRMQWNNFGF